MNPPVLAPQVPAVDSIPVQRETGDSRRSVASRHSMKTRIYPFDHQHLELAADLMDRHGTAGQRLALGLTDLSRCLHSKLIHSFCIVENERVMALSIESDCGVRNVMNVLVTDPKVSVESTRELIDTTTHWLIEHGVPRVLTKEISSSALASLKDCGYVYQPHDVWLSLPLPEETLPLGPLDRSTEVFEMGAQDMSILRRFVESLDGIEFNEWETDDKLQYFFSDNGFLLGLRKDGALVAICFFSIGGFEPMIFHAAVSPELRGGGLGKRLITEGIRRVRERSAAKQIILLTHRQRSSSLGFWEKIGFVQNEAALYQYDR